MKRILYILFAAIIATVYVGCSEEDYSIRRVDSPTELSATRGDTSVFLKWNKVSGASFYTLVRGLKVIADSLHDESFEDALAPDTLTEYRVYAVSDMGWRSATYACDSGYLGVPNGIIPRAPIKIEASTDDVRGCVLKWTDGRFATSYKLYRDGEFCTDVTGNEYIDYKASTKSAVYELYSVNDNGKSEKCAKVTGKKSYLCIDDFDNYAEGKIIQPWTGVVDRVMYYTEGNPMVSNHDAFSGTQCMVIKSGKVQILHDWGGAKYEGYYIVSFLSKKENGGFNVYSNFGVDERYGVETSWTRHSYKTGILSKGGTFNLTIESKSDDEPLLIDDFSIEYLAN